MSNPAGRTIKKILVRGFFLSGRGGAEKNPRKAGTKSSANDAVRRSRQAGFSFFFKYFFSVFRGVGGRANRIFKNRREKRLSAAFFYYNFVMVKVRKKRG